LNHPSYHCALVGATMLSYSKGPELPLRDESLYEAFAACARRFPDCMALISRPDKVHWIYRELLNEVERTARGLVGLGLHPGDRVAIWAPSCPEWVLLQLACPRVGVVLVNVNPAYRALDLGYVIRKSRIRAIFHRSRDVRANYDEILQESIAASACSLEYDIQIGGDSWRAMLANGVEFADDRVDPHSVVNIQYTSGTTGNPKGVQLTHFNVVNNAWFTANTLSISEEDRLCQTFPLYHTAGYTCSSLVCFISGATLVIPSPMFDPQATLQAIEAERITILYGVPSMFISELDHPDFRNTDVSSIRAAIVGGAPCPVELLRRMAERLGTGHIYNIYGQTEASPGITFSGKEDTLELRTTTIGKPMPKTEVKIADVLTGETLPTGEQGELCARGYCVMKGYDDDPEATARAIDQDGWLHTGDLAVMRPDGYLNITGRAKDMIIRGGENIYPREIENLLYTHPKVADVQVLGIPDEKLGEAIVAWIRLKTGEGADENEIRDFCQGKIAHFKIPQHFRFVEQFPMTASGKVQKFRIRQMEIEMRQLQRIAKIQTA
jgi:fatty-acyl-CoA synthase